MGAIIIGDITTLDQSGDRSICMSSRYVGPLAEANKNECQGVIAFNGFRKPKASSVRPREVLMEGERILLAKPWKISLLALYPEHESQFMEHSLHCMKNSFDNETRRANHLDSVNNLE